VLAIGGDSVDMPQGSLPASASVPPSDPLTPQWFGMPPPPQVAGAVQVPHMSGPPQPSLAAPQLYPIIAHVIGVQVPGMHLPPGPQLEPPSHVPQFAVRPPQPSD
jgi:hypothetical protein